MGGVGRGDGVSEGEWMCIEGSVGEIEGERAGGFDLGMN